MRLVIMSRMCLVRDGYIYASYVSRICELRTYLKIGSKRIQSSVDVRAAPSAGRKVLPALQAVTCLLARWSEPELSNTESYLAFPQTSGFQRSSAVRDCWLWDGGVPSDPPGP